MHFEEDFVIHGTALRVTHHQNEVLFADQGLVCRVQYDGLLLEVNFCHGGSFPVESSDDSVLETLPVHKVAVVLWKNQLDFFMQVVVDGRWQLVSLETDLCREIELYLEVLGVFNVKLVVARRQFKLVSAL